MSRVGTLRLSGGAVLQAGALLPARFSYHNKITFHAKGTTKSIKPIVNTPMEIDTELQFSAPHYFRTGAALFLLRNKLLIAGTSSTFCTPTPTKE